MPGVRATGYAAAAPGRELITTGIADDLRARLARAARVPVAHRRAVRRHVPVAPFPDSVAPMSYEDTISDIVRVVEAVGAGIMVLGGLGAFLVFARQALKPETADGSYERLRRNLGRSILLGLEVLIVADIVRTIIVDPTLESVAVLGIIVVIRIMLSFSLEVEMDGVWPWRRGRPGRAAAEPPPGT